MDKLTETELKVVADAKLDSVFKDVFTDGVSKIVKASELKKLWVLVSTNQTIADMVKSEKICNYVKNMKNNIINFIDKHNETYPNNAIKLEEVFGGEKKNNTVLITADYTPSVSAVNPTSINKISDEKVKAAVIEIDQKMTATNASCRHNFVSQLDYDGSIWGRYVFSGMQKDATGQTVKGYLTVLHRTPQEYQCQVMTEQEFMTFNRYINPYVVQMTQPDLDLINWAEEQMHNSIKTFESQLTNQFVPTGTYEQYVQVIAPGCEDTQHIINIYRDRKHVEYGGCAPWVNITLPEGTDETKIGVESDYFDQTSFQGIDPRMAQLIYHNAKMINTSERIKIILNCFKLKDKFKVFNGTFVASCENGDTIQITIIPTNNGPAAQVISWKVFDMCTCDKHAAA